MQTSPNVLAPRFSRDSLILAVTTFLVGQDPATLERIHAALADAIDEAGPEALAALNARFAGAGADWDYYPRDPLARRIHHAIADVMLERESAIVGLDHVHAVAGRPVVIFANHLSYSDANLLEILLQRSGASALADRLTTIAGPKVYSNLQRRFSSLCFGTIKVAQSSALSSDDAVMGVRDVARAARQSIAIAHERLRVGEALLIFPEGTRSRTEDMQPMLAGVTRYLDVPDVVILPIGITGTEALFPIGEDRLNLVRIVAHAGRPIDAGELRRRTDGSRRLMMDVIGLAIAGELPPTYRGAYADGADGMADARVILRELHA